MLEELKNMRWTWHQGIGPPMYAYLLLSLLSRDWYRPNFRDNKSTYNALLLGFCLFLKIWHKLIDSHALRKSAITFAQGRVSRLVSIWDNKIRSDSSQVHSSARWTVTSSPKSKYSICVVYQIFRTYHTWKCLHENCMCFVVLLGFLCFVFLLLFFFGGVCGCGCSKQLCVNASVDYNFLWWLAVIWFVSITRARFLSPILKPQSLGIFHPSHLTVFYFYIK